MMIWGFGTTYIVLGPEQIGNRDAALIVPHGEVMDLSGEGELVTLYITRDRMERWVMLKDFKIILPEPTILPTYTIDISEKGDFITGTFDDMIEKVFAEWFAQFVVEDESCITQTPEQFKEAYPQIFNDIQKAFRGGWLACEKYYEDES